MSKTWHAVQVFRTYFIFDRSEARLGILIFLGVFKKLARMTRMACTVARMARWLADFADPDLHLNQVCFSTLSLNLSYL